MKKRKLIAISSVLAVVLLISTFAALTMQSQSQGTDEPASMHELLNYPGAVETRDLTQEEIDIEIVSMQLSGEVRGIPIEGIHDVRQRLHDKGYMPTGTGGDFAVDSFFDVFVDIQVWSPDGLEALQGAAFKGWTNTMLPDGTKAMIVGCVLQDPITLQNYSMILGVPTNVLPPEQMPGVDPYIIWNAEPFWYVQHYWWFWGVPSRLVYWQYWWYDSHKSPNWFWGTYWWWRTYIIDYTGYYHWWYWWWWHWYYWRGWYFWSTHWPYY